MDNLPPEANNQAQNIWEANPKLKVLLLVLIFVFLASGIALVVLSQIGQNYRQKLYEQTENSLPKHKETQIETWTSYPVDILNMEISLPSNWELKNVEGLDGAVMAYPKDLYNSSYEHDFVILIEASDTTSTVFEKKDKFGCMFSNTSLAGLPAVLCKENGASLVSYFYRVTETPGTRWSGQNMVSFSLPKSRLDLLPTYEKVLNSLKIFVEEMPEANKKSWETYVNEDYGFEIGYPEKYGQYTLLSEGEDAGGEGSGFFGLTIYGMPKVLSSQDFAVPENFVNLDIKEGESIDNWLKVYSEIPDIEVGDVSKEKIGNLDVTTYRSILTTERGPDAVLRWALWEKDGSLYGYNCPVDKYTQLCSEVLNTFKFTK